MRVILDISYTIQNKNFAAYVKTFSSGTFLLQISSSPEYPGRRFTFSCNTPYFPQLITSQSLFCWISSYYCTCTAMSLLSINRPRKEELWVTEMTALVASYFLATLYFSSSSLWLESTSIKRAYFHRKLSRSQ
jgi:hypothetical protein